jgi:membrane protease YdiL (CAAX protease family)
MDFGSGFAGLGEDLVLTYQRRLGSVAVVIPLAWLTATMLGHLFGLGLTITVASIGMAIVAAAMLPSLFRSLLAPSWRLILIGVAAGAVMIAATYILFPVVTSICPLALSATKSLYGLIPPRTTLPIVAIVYVIILAEEMMWRGVVQEAIAARLRPIGAVIVSALVYGLSHAPIGSPLLVIVAVFCGLYWSALRWKTGSLIPGLVSHLLWDTAVLVHRLVIPS